ncbi:hypothetical protein GTP45_05770 [Pseudoduganella sp. FT55W]|uniref:Uncharacterized protein n=1 Tax=Duganella rivi TaxID=2666083 RepID=A0A7X4GMS1_9BURK|nr:hypothetical protein [Duganella rivi]MYM66343.1 hypothetical protein [Duganella rivi]
MKRPIFALALLHCSAPLLAQNQSVEVKIKISKQEKVGGVPKPFPGIGGLKAMREGKPAEEFSCDDPTDKDGYLSCHISCKKEWSKTNVKIIPPSNDKETALGYYSPEGKYLYLTLESCKVSSATPINLVYLSPEVVFSRVAANSPNVFKAVTSNEVNENVAIRDFSDAAPELLKLDPTPENKEGIAKLSALARTYGIALQKNPVATEYRNLVQYDQGGKNLLLKVESTEYLGEEVSNQIEVAPDKAALKRNIQTLESALASRPELTAKEKAMAEKIQLMQRQP